MTLSWSVSTCYGFQGAGWSHDLVLMFFPLSAAPCVSVLFANDCSVQKCLNGKKRIQLLMARTGIISEHSRGAAPRAVIFQRKRMSHADRHCAQRMVVKRDAGKWAVLAVRNLLTQRPNLDKMWRQERTRCKEIRIRAWKNIFREQRKRYEQIDKVSFFTPKREANCSTRLTYLCMQMYV